MALHQHDFVILRGANDQFDHLAVQQQRLEDDRSDFALGLRQKDRNG